MLFNNNIAKSGGAFLANNINKVSLQNITFINNIAYNFGGAINLASIKILYIKDIISKKNKANEGGLHI